MESVELPLLPYAGSSGHAGSQASRERADRQDRDGTTSERQKETLRYLSWRRTDGATWHELADHLAVHHGAASALLSVLHKSGMICRLQEKRNRCHVYVTPQYVAGRAHDPFHNRTSRGVLTEAIDIALNSLYAGNVIHAISILEAVVNNKETE